MQVGAEHAARVGALGPVAVARAERGAGERPGVLAEPRDALVVLEAGQRAHVQPGVDVGHDLADRAPLAPAAAHVEQAEPLHGGVVGAAELRAEHW